MLFAVAKSTVIAWSAGAERDTVNVAAVVPELPSVSQLSQVISQAAAPAFLLGALAAFIAVLISRFNRIVDRTIVLNAIADNDAAKSGSRQIFRV